ncbi:hypothetical protein Q31b_13990 [Novipirellula aureliae]|uniref:Uncharacterized protein n=1 Tax=Novipirellula aureliae TaxID=2527966 RepID=A0A5C6E7E0_9BACT|nr:hypothetical protein [Novipirellula aureliae]TWU43867.1 hypothetical protein Q31b_13990 [Novipirellula aureliae]
MTNAANAASLDRAEFVEQGYLFQLLRERIGEQMPMQDLLEQLRFELLATTKLPMAIDFLLTELKHSGVMAPAMQRLSHYFTSFQTYLMQESESDTGRFDTSTALMVLEADAKYRAAGATPAGMFLYQFEALCRNRLNYDKGLTAMSFDPIYDSVWAKWILMLRAQIGLIELADLLFLASDEYKRRLIEANQPTEEKEPFLFGEREGRIAFGNRRKEPLYLFAAMQRHLGYPAVPRPAPPNKENELIPQMARRIERLEARIKLLEEEQRSGVDITKFYEANKNKIKLPD